MTTRVAIYPTAAEALEAEIEHALSMSQGFHDLIRKSTGSTGSAHGLPRTGRSLAGEGKARGTPLPEAPGRIAANAVMV